MGLRDITRDRYGQMAYDTYARAVGGKSVAGDTLWSWAEMKANKPHIADAWCEAAQAVLTIAAGAED